MEAPLQSISGLQIQKKSSEGSLVCYDSLNVQDGWCLEAVQR